MENYKSTYTGSQIDTAVGRALPGGAIDLSIEDKQYWEFLDNADFTNPVAQAGIGGLHGSVAYAVDRWKLISGTVSWDSNGLTLNGTVRQIREFPIGFPVVPSIEMHSGTATITYDDTTKYCDITSAGGVIKRPHLGLTDITDWSKIPPADYGEGLRKCQRYCVVFSNVGGTSNFIGTGTVDNDTSGQGFIELPVTMRATPTIIGTLSIYNVLNNKECSGVSVIGVNQNKLRVNYTFSTADTTERLCLLYTESNLVVSADL